MTFLFTGSLIAGGEKLKNHLEVDLPEQPKNREADPDAFRPPAGRYKADPVSTHSLGAQFFAQPGMGEIITEMNKYFPDYPPGIGND